MLSRNSSQFATILCCILLCVFSAEFLSAGGRTLWEAEHLPDKAPLELVNGFFTAWTQQDTETAIKPLFSIFPIASEGKNTLINSVTRLKTRLGEINGADFLGFRRLAGSNRYAVLFFLSYHDLMPVAWEFTFYRPQQNGPWQLNFLRFESDDLFEFIYSLPREYDQLIEKRGGQPPSSVSP